MHLDLYMDLDLDMDMDMDLEEGYGVEAFDATATATASPVMCLLLLPPMAACSSAKRAAGSASSRCPFLAFSSFRKSALHQSREHAHFQSSCALALTQPCPGSGLRPPTSH